ncbi:MAG: hypothetical protein OQJ84_03575, partial [Xanthomonadales bacterium]|nr:hypothetical protein [Xanthomonadales bacterium]
MNRLLFSSFWILSLLATLPSALASQDGWPRTLALEEGTVTVYALQVDSMDDGLLQSRAALAYRPTPGSTPIFGAGWFESQFDVDQSRQIVWPRNLKVTDTRFPAGTADIQADFAAALTAQSASWNLELPLDELQADLQLAESESEALHASSTKPPKIVYRDRPALLVTIDGEPVRREIEDSPYEAVINTPYPLITDGRTYYLNAAKDVWYRASEVAGPYRFDTNPPTDIVAMVKADEADADEEVAVEQVTAANAPEVVVSMEPAELLVTDGPAAFVPLVDDLLVLQNSEEDVFMHVSSQQFYIVLAGRWYHAKSLYGPWSYQAADALPSAFALIPENSEQADSRVYVAGTEEAREAVLDAYIPQTAAVERGEVDIEVAYDGEPSFQPVDGTDLVYAENSGSTVLYSDRVYYLVEDGVWYVATSPDGPWQVSDYRPDEVDTILPSSPVYNVKYVYVYDSTPEIVYVGYTPGYTGSYVYHDTIIYGTGWHYRPWVSPRYYYPRPYTWGFNVRYDPWYGWDFGLSWNWGPFRFGYYPGGYWHRSHYWHHRHYGNWGPYGYRHRYPRPDHHRYDRYSHRDHGRDRGRHDRDYRDYGSERHRNLYRDRDQPAHIADTRDLTFRQRNARHDARQTNNRGYQGSRGETQMGDKKVGRSRLSPIRATELATKASIRDANAVTKQRRLVTSRNGSKKGAGEKNRITPVRRTGTGQLSSAHIRPAASPSDDT